MQSVRIRLHSTLATWSIDGVVGRRLRAYYQYGGLKKHEAAT